MTTWNAPKLMPLSGAYDSEQKVQTGAKEGIGHTEGSTEFVKAAYTNS